MTMKPALIIALGIVSTIAVSAQAETYQWKDANGRTIVSDTPPPGSAIKGSRALGTSPAPVSEKPKSEEASKTADAPKSNAEKDMEFKKRQQEAKEKADKDSKEKTAEADKKDNCDRARRNLTALESTQPMATLDDKGERKIMDNSQREAEMERARKFMAESCK